MKNYNKDTFDHLKMIKCNNEIEWAAAQHFRQKYFFDQAGLQDPYT